MNASSYESYLGDLVKTCLANKIDGLVFRQTQFDEEAKQAL